MGPPAATALLRAFDVCPGAVVALIGGGGKTTLMERMAMDAAEAGYRVLITTTTRIRAPRSVAVILASELDMLSALVAQAWETRPVVAVAASVDTGDKLRGLPPDVVCALATRLSPVVVICEADGSAGMPLKAHADYEPVIPRCATAVGVIGGLDAVNRPVLSDVIHRIELVERPYGIGDIVTPALMAELLALSADRVPGTCSTVYVLNKADSPARKAAAARVARHLVKLRPGAHIAVAAWGRVFDEGRHVSLEHNATGG